MIKKIILILRRILAFKVVKASKKVLEFHLKILKTVLSQLLQVKDRMVSLLALHHNLERRITKMEINSHLCYNLKDLQV